jgi:FlaA1/EpsC-like NDP-sugar epimerase
MDIRLNPKRWTIIVMDLFLSILALAFSYLIRFDLKADQARIEKEWNVLSKSILFYLGIKFIVFYGFKIHKGLVRHTSLEDVRRIFLAVLSCSTIYLGSGLFRYFFLDGVFLFPTSVLILEFLTAFLFMIGSRFMVKLWHLERNRPVQLEERVLVYGAGISGLIAKRTIEKDRKLSYKLVGFIDDNVKFSGNRLEGLGIFHTSKLEKLIKEEGVTLVIIAIQHPDEDNRKRVVEVCFSNKVKVQKVPNPSSWINGEFSTKQIGQINIEDLLGRKPIVLDKEQIASSLNDKVVLITGAAGSIGSGLTHQIAGYNPKLLVLLDQAESPMYELQHELLMNFRNVAFEVVIGDIRSKERLERVFTHYKPQVVFHAAAYKHVPLMEDNPSEAVLTNIKGTKHLVDLCDSFNVEKMVMISTDKAVNPTNVMGASKRIAEMYAQSANQHSNTKFITTRFGNVLGSNGSVIPLFQKQITQGGPITLTDERITRFFMTIPEACQLVLEAGAMGEGGEIFVFDMGESVKIIDLAKKMIQLSGLELGKDIEIKTIGLRPGEKLYEELLANDENTLPTHHPKILKAKVREINADQIVRIDQLITLFEKQENEEMVRIMKEIVPEFKSQNSSFEKLDK